MKKRLLLLVLLLVLLNCLLMPAYAHEIPDPEQKGSICLSMDWKGEPMDGGSLTLYRVGDIAESDGDYTFTLVEALKGTGLTLDNVSDLALAQKLADAAKALTPITAEIKNGKVLFDDLEPGLYVVTQSEKQATSGFLPTQPFLISLPRWEEDGYVYDLTAYPKVSPEPEPTETTEPTTKPPKPNEPNIPQMGQTNWPVPVLVVGGLMLIVLGGLLRSGKRDECET